MFFFKWLKEVLIFSWKFIQCLIWFAVCITKVVQGSKPVTSLSVQQQRKSVLKRIKKAYGLEVSDFCWTCLNLMPWCTELLTIWTAGVTSSPYWNCWLSVSLKDLLKKLTNKHCQNKMPVLQWRKSAIIVGHMFPVLQLLASVLKKPCWNKLISLIMHIISSGGK